MVEAFKKYLRKILRFFLALALHGHHECIGDCAPAIFVDLNGGGVDEGRLPPVEVVVIFEEVARERFPLYYFDSTAGEHSRVG